MLVLAPEAAGADVATAARVRLSGGYAHESRTGQPSVSEPWTTALADLSLVFDSPRTHARVTYTPSLTLR